MVWMLFLHYPHKNTIDDKHIDQEDSPMQGGIFADTAVTQLKFSYLRTGETG